MRFFELPVITLSLALLVFVVAFYALTARERKAPHTLSTIYSIAFLLLVSAILDFLSIAVNAHYPIASEVLKVFSVLSFGFTMFYLIFQVARIQNQHRRLRDDNILKNLPIVQHIRHLIRRISSKPEYEHTPEPQNTKLFRSIEGVLKEHSESSETEFQITRNTYSEECSLSPSICVFEKTIQSADGLLAEVAALFLKNECWVHYLSCQRSPCEFVDRLKSSTTAEDWKKRVGRLIVIDAYTPHFGFQDSIHREVRHRLENDGVLYLASKPSFSGVHTSTAKAFNLTKSETGGKTPRQFTLLIYEGCSALRDIESEYQFLIFLRHVIASERVWGGLVSIWVEPKYREDDLGILKFYCRPIIKID